MSKSRQAYRNLTKKIIVISVAAARAGKHVLGEKPFANLPSLKRITAACRDNGVGFMDGTHFPHHPRTAQIRSHMQEAVGWPWSVSSAFQFSLTDTQDIRLRPDLEEEVEAAAELHHHSAASPRQLLPHRRPRLRPRQLQRHRRYRQLRLRPGPRWRP